MPPKTQDLSLREREVASLYASGKSAKEISNKLCISQTTVRNHVATIYRKLKVRNKTELINLMGKHGNENSLVATNTDSEAIVSQSPVESIIESALTSIKAQQLATSEVLRVISHSPGDIDAIFDVTLDYALQLSHSQLGIVYLYIDGGFQATGLKNVPAAFQKYLQAEPLFPGPKTGLGRMARQRRIIHIHDVRSEDLYRVGDPLRLATVDLGGARSFLAIPMVHRDSLVGAFTIYRQVVKPFTDDELGLLRSFSDQAAIALTITRLLETQETLMQKINEQADEIKKMQSKLITINTKPG
jgi:DNA-binding CsgD family transcriptional regulator